MSIRWTPATFLSADTTSLCVAAVILACAASLAASPYTEKQIEALRGYVGKTYWVGVAPERKPPFLSAASPDARPISARPKESFQITDLIPGPKNALYYKTEFTSGKVGFINAEDFLERLNAAILTQDPDSGQNEKAERETQAEVKRVALIRAQPWPERIKEAAIKRQAILGMTMTEVKIALGKPIRVIRLQIPGARQEQWVYPNYVLTFNGGSLDEIQKVTAKPE